MCVRRSNFMSHPYWIPTPARNHYATPRRPCHGAYNPEAVAPSDRHPEQLLRRFCRFGSFLRCHSCLRVSCCWIHARIVDRIINLSAFARACVCVCADPNPRLAFILFMEDNNRFLCYRCRPPMIVDLTAPDPAVITIED